MKHTSLLFPAITAIFLSLPLVGFSQITDTAVNKEKFEKSGFPYRGERVLMVDNISTPKEENLYIFSKNKWGTAQDSLYIEQFQKTDKGWSRTAAKVVAEKGLATSTWGSRKMFLDADKDGKADVVYVYSKSTPEDLDHTLSVVLTVIYKNEFYTIEGKAKSNYNANADEYSANYKKLPASLKERVAEFWLKLDKSSN